MPVIFFFCRFSLTFSDESKRGGGGPVFGSHDFFPSPHRAIFLSCRSNKSAVSSFRRGVGRRGGRSADQFKWKIIRAITSFGGLYGGGGRRRRRTKEVWSSGVKHGEKLISPNNACGQTDLDVDRYGIRGVGGWWVLCASNGYFRRPLLRHRVAGRFGRNSTDRNVQYGDGRAAILLDGRRSVRAKHDDDAEK